VGMEARTTAVPAAADTQLTRETKPFKKVSSGPLTVGDQIREDQRRSERRSDQRRTEISGERSRAENRRNQLSQEPEDDT
jgi:hypothetical protein